MFGSLSAKIAHATPVLGNQDLRLLQESINKEKEVVNSAQRLAKDAGIAADALKQWGAGEGEDLADVTNATMYLLSHIGAAINTFADHELAIRAHLKEIRTKEEQLDELRRRRRAVATKLEAQEKKLSKMGPENKSLSLATEQLATLQHELRQLDTSILVDMARLSDAKRHIMRSIVTLKFGGLAELGEKLTVVGELGKLIAAEVPQEVTSPGQGRAPYTGRERTANLIAEASRCVGEVRFSPNPGEGYAATRASNMRHQPPGPAGPIPAGASSLSVPADRGDGSQFRENSNSSLGQQVHHRPQQSSTSSMGGTMPPLRDLAPQRPVDEFGRPIDGIPIQANTMPARPGTGPIQQAPLTTIQQSMQPLDGPVGSTRSRRPLGSDSQSIPSQNQPPSQGSQYSHQSIPRKPAPAVDLERGLTLSLPLRSRQGTESSEPNDKKEVDSAFVPPLPSGAPSAFKHPGSPPIGLQRQQTKDSDVSLNEREVHLKRVSTLPPKVGIDDFPVWSLGFGELGIDSEVPTKEEAKDSAPVLEAEQPQPAPPAKDTVVVQDLKPPASISRDTLDVSSNNQTQVMTQTPTTYGDTPTSYAPIIQHHLVDDPVTRTGSNSGRFAMFPDKRKGTEGPTAVDSSLAPPHAEFSSHPGINRRPSPYPTTENTSSLPNPLPTGGEEVIPINTGTMVHLERNDMISPASRSILVDPSSRSTLPLASSATGTPSETGPPRIRFTSRPTSPRTPSPVNPNSSGRASKEDIDSGNVGSVGKNGEEAEVTGISMVTTEGSPEKSAERKAENRLSVITPLGIHKKDGNSQPTTPRHEQAPTVSEMSEEQFNAMLDSFQAAVGPFDNSSHGPSGVGSTNTSLLSSESNTSSDLKNNISLNSGTDPTASHHYLSTRGANESFGSDYANTSSRSVPNSSINSTAAVAGSLFPSPTPPSVAPASGLAHQEHSGQPISGYQGPKKSVESVNLRQASTDSDVSDNSPGAHTIPAGAFKRMPVEKGPAVGTESVGSIQKKMPGGEQATLDSSIAISSPTLSSVPRRLSYQMPNVFPPASSPDSPVSDLRHDPYRETQAVPSTTSSDLASLPPGAARPLQFAGPEPAFSGGDAHWGGQASPPGSRSRSPIIPSSLIPGRPGSAAPLAPIGHTRPVGPSPSGYSTGHPQSSYGSNQGNVIPPWQQQQTFSSGASQVNSYGGPSYGQQQRLAQSSLSGDFDGNSLLQDASGGKDDSPYAGARFVGQQYPQNYR